ncbi:MAG: methylenetetrahydrofolate reductase [Bacteroidota bacterium]
MGVACYPEKHFQSPNLRYDLQILKDKQDAGAHYAVTQMFYDTDKYFEFVQKARDFGITMPIVPGMKIMTSKGQLSRLPSIFHIDIPEELTDRMLTAKSREEEIQVGIDWAMKQSLALLEADIPYLHFYIMQNTSPFVKLMDRLKKKL